MICDGRDPSRLSQSIEVILGDLPENLPGEVKARADCTVGARGVATQFPCANVAEAGDQLSASCAARCVRSPPGMGLAIGAGGNPPGPRCTRTKLDRRQAPATGELAAGAQLDRRAGSSSFGNPRACRHRRCGEGGPTSRTVCAGYLPLLLGMSSNSPLWRGRTTG